MSFGVPDAGDGARVLRDVVWVESVKSQIYVEGETETYNERSLLLRRLSKNNPVELLRQCG
jgi:hypothetical protein